MDDLLGEFVAECRDMLEALGGEIVAWEADPADKGRLDSIFRFVHTVKGNCGFFDFPRLEALSHAAEDALADVRAGRRQADPALVNAVLAIIDRIGEMVAAIESGAELPAGSDEALIAALQPDAEAAELPAPLATGDRSAKATGAQRTIRLPVELLDRLMSGVSDMVLARNDLARRLREVTTEATIDGPFERLSAIIAEMRDAITRTRMQRLDNLFGALPRLVRDLSNELGKQVMVDIEGGDVELDREMIELIRDPLTHIIRNAVDHGLEPPAERLAAGKREIGLLTIAARQSGNQITIEVADDGRGIDGERLVEKAIAAGTLTAAEGARLPARARYALMFEPGLSTADSVTAISGRGVGMDVVRSNVERIGGVIEVDSVPGEGTRMSLRVPLTLTIIPALTVSSGGQRFGIPRSAIEEIVHAGSDAIELSQMGNGVLAKIRDKRVPCLALADVLEVPSEFEDGCWTLVVLRLASGDLFALAVDRVHDHEELVIKPAAPPVMATGIYAGTTLADDGSPILLLDVAGLAAAGKVVLEARERPSRTLEQSATIETRTTPVLLFVGLDGQRRALRMGVIERIEEVSASAVEVAAGQLRVVLDGRILPLAGVAGTPPATGKVQLFRLGDGQRELGYAVGEVLEMASLDDDLVPAEHPGEIEGVALIDGQPAEVVDAHWLFARHAPLDQRGPARVCRLPASDAWVQGLLRPLVESAGYRVIDDNDEAHADVAFAALGEAGPTPAASRLIWLRASLEPSDDAPASVYRYDRDALIQALSVGNGRA